VRIEDARGRTLTFQEIPRRIVCLVPSVTETLFALGAGERVVGVTDFCVHPSEEVVTCAKVGGTKNPQLERVIELRPDLVIANREENRRRDVDRLEAAGLPVLVTYARDVESALEEIELLARLLDSEETARGLVREVRDALEEAAARLGEPLPSVVALIWKRPYMTLNGDTFAHDLLVRSGGRNPFVDRERRYPLVTEKEIEEAEPEVILLPTEPYAFDERDRQELLRLRCPAAESRRIHVVEGELLSWYGPRMGRALRTFSALLHP
jgi:ABC-type Fe3+-hydroxamate transport system substrate-binding protein